MGLTKPGIPVLRIGHSIKIMKNKGVGPRQPFPLKLRPFQRNGAANSCWLNTLNPEQNLAEVLRVLPTDEVGKMHRVPALLRKATSSGKNLVRCPVAEGARLESVYTATYRGFESLPTLIYNLLNFNGVFSFLDLRDFFLINWVEQSCI